MGLQDGYDTVELQPGVNMFDREGHESSATFVDKKKSSAVDPGYDIKGMAAQAYG